MSSNDAQHVPGSVLGTITSVNTADRKGQRKKPLESGEVTVMEHFGCIGDAHADAGWHRQVSFLAEESIDKARTRGLDVSAGDFAENFTTEGFTPFELPLGTRLKVGGSEVEISQIGKVCHTRCAIYHLAGDCIFPREGVFAVVEKSGKVCVGDEVELIEWGNGTCSSTPDEALEEIDAARLAGLL